MKGGNTRIVVAFVLFFFFQITAEDTDTSLNEVDPNDLLTQMVCSLGRLVEPINMRVTS